MRKISFPLAFLFLIAPLFSFAGPGDTITVRSHDHVPWTWYGNKYQWAEFPAPNVQYRKVLLKYTLGCPPTGCSEWDYTTAIRLREYTGEWDSTLALAPDFTQDGNAPDSSCYSLDTTWSYFFDSTAMATDSMPAGQWQIHLFEDLQDHYLATDSFWVWPGDYWNYWYDSSGSVIDSNWVAADTCRFQTYDSVYTPFEKTRQWELARLITPYAGQYANSWENTWTFDITDFAPMLHDSVEINAFYGGWQNGWEISLDFEFIEGTPPRESKSIDRLWNGTFNYGSTTNPIENHLLPRSVFIDDSTASAKVRITTTGHSFGGAQNCAEFCHKVHDVIIGNTTYQQDLWRADCDFNPLYPQAGTWIYDRAGWCPGSEVRPYDFEATPHITSGDTLNVDYNTAAYTYLGGAGFHPNYIVEGFLFQYAAAPHLLDAELYDIHAPTNNDMYARDNPICQEPKVMLRNAGTTSLTSVDITYGLKGGQMKTYTWTGNLDFMEMEEVALPKPIWGGLAASGNTFIATVSNPNQGTDEYALNDAMESTFDAPREFEADWYLFWRTNGAVGEISYRIFDQYGTQLYINDPFLSANTIYRDTFNFSDGCYTFRFTDTGQDGLSFFANNDGTGFARFKKVSDGNTFLTLNPDFGGGVTVQFTVGNELSTAPEFAGFVDIYPNPTSGKVNVDIEIPQNGEVRLSVMNIHGQKLQETSFSLNGITSRQLDLSSYGKGIYLVQVSSPLGSTVKKIVVK